MPYCQKALVTHYENATPIQFRLLTPEDGATMVEFGALRSLKRFPIRVEAGRTALAARIIRVPGFPPSRRGAPVGVAGGGGALLEYLDFHHPGAVRLIPRPPQDALACG